MTLYLNAASLTREDSQSYKEKTYPLAHYLCGGLAARCPYSAFGDLADVACCSSLACAAVVVAAGVLYSPARVGRLVPESHGLAGQLVGLQRRLRVPYVDVEIGRRFRGAVAVVAARAVLSGVPGVVA